MIELFNFFLIIYVEILHTACPRSHRYVFALIVTLKWKVAESVEEKFILNLSERIKNVSLKIYNYKT